MLLRLSAPGREMLLQSPSLVAQFGGAEANVAVSLARFGLDAAFVTAAPQNNALAEAGLGELRRHGVDTKSTLRAPGRLGIYFITPGALQRPSDILYDRADSSFANAAPDLIDWTKTLSGADWLHVSGVTPAVSASAGKAALKALKAARAQGVRVSLDCNFRAKLWEARGEDPRPVLAALMAEADLMFADARDIELTTGKSASGADNAARNLSAAEIAFTAFPNLQRMACTMREVVSVDHNRLSGAMFTRKGACATQRYELNPIVDRIGGGDAFAAGVLHGLCTGASDQETLDFAVAAACLKHSIPGDFNLSSAEDVLLFLSDSRFDVRR
jgi:2-dehydro-3-deoxygluconokinase